jgi:hypothetical protein
MEGRMKRIGVAAAVLIALIPSVVLGAIAATPAHEVQDRIIVRGGVIRLGTSVYLLENSAHAAPGITSLTLLNRCDLRVFTDKQPGEAVVFAIAEEDETLARLQVEAGVSGGNGYANVYLYRRGTHVCANNSMFGSNGNIWLQIVSLAPPSP